MWCSLPRVSSDVLRAENGLQKTEQAGVVLRLYKSCWCKINALTSFTWDAFHRDVFITVSYVKYKAFGHTDLIREHNSWQRISGHREKKKKEVCGIVYCSNFFLYFLYRLICVMILKQKHKTRLINHVTYRRIRIKRTKTATTSTTNTHQELSLWTPSNCSSFSKAHQIHQHKSFLPDQYHTPTLAPHLGSENWIPVQVLLGNVGKLPSFDCQAPVAADFWPYRLARVSSLDHFTAIVYDNRKPVRRDK